MIAGVRRLDRAPVCTTQGWHVAREAWSFGWPMSLWLGFGALTLYTDRFILGFVAAPEVVGRYTSASDLIVRGLSMLAAPIVMTVHPAYMAAHNAGELAQAEQMLRRWSSALAGILGVACLLGALLGPVILSALTNAGSFDRTTLVLLCLGAGAWQYALLAHKRLEAANCSRTLLMCILAAWLVEVACALALIPWIGARGAAAGMAVGSLVYLSLVILRRSVEPKGGGNAL
jgi:O-antigen/teichoic acid export membrane protein